MGQFDTCQRWFHAACVGWAHGATGESVCVNCEQAGGSSPIKLTIWQQDRTGGVKAGAPEGRQTSPSKRERDVEAKWGKSIGVVV